MKLEIGAAYLISDLDHAVWDNPHKRFGQPPSIAGRYLGYLQGQRIWHLFEVVIAGKDEGAILMNESDFDKITIKEL